MCKKLLLSMFKQLGNEAGARLKPHRDRCGLDWCVGVVSEERGMCRERDRQEGCAGSETGGMCWERDRRDVLGAGELRNAELRNGMMGSAMQHEPAG